MGMGAMIERFKEERVLVAALQEQQLIKNDQTLAEEVARAAELRSFGPGDALIEEDGVDNDIYLLLAGRVEVRVGGRALAERGPGRQVGEMAALDPSARRSASVIALEETVAAVLDESTFSRLSSSHPAILKRVCVELASRLRERGGHVRTRNETPRVFVGCSVEGLAVARAIQAEFHHDDDIIVKLWTQGVFEPSHYTIDDLLEEARRSDFAVLVFLGDDTTTSRKKKQASPRDNVVFEMGLFMGALLRERTFYVTPRRAKIKIPSDLLGLTPLTYKKPGNPSDLRSALGPVCSKIRERIQQLGPL